MIDKLKVTRFLTKQDAFDKKIRQDSKFKISLSQVCKLNYSSYCLFYLSKFYLSYPSGLQKAQLKIQPLVSFSKTPSNPCKHSPSLFRKQNLLLYFSNYFQGISVSFQSLSNKCYFNQMFSDFIIVTIILFAVYLFHTAFTLSISSNFIFIILLICFWLSLYKLGRGSKL